VDKYSLIGVLLGVFAVFGGAVLEGIPISAVIIPTAALIVFGGTIGAVFLQASAHEVKCAKQMFGKVFKEPVVDVEALVREILDLSKIARRDGMLALETKLATIQDPFLVKALGLLIDGVASKELRERLEIAMEKEEEKYSDAARVFEAAGGYAPTIGILGAVLGLIHVMKSLDDPSKLGPGIAVAFVATIYGVGLANLVALPAAGKLKSRGRAATANSSLILEGVAGIADGQPTSALEQTLRLMAGDHGGGGKDPQKKAA
jgi:chemotaxis protein MotA